MHRIACCFLVGFLLLGCTSGEKPQPVAQPQRPAAPSIDREQLKGQLKNAFTAAKEVAQTELQKMQQEAPAQPSVDTVDNLFVEAWWNLVGSSASEEPSSLVEPVWWRAAVFGFGRLLKLW